MIAAIILAGGFSSRMGRDKAMLGIPGGASFLARLASTFFAAGCDRVVAVVGPATAPQVAGAIEHGQLPVELVLNVDPSRGQLSSLQAGLRYLAPDSPRAVLLCPVDQPLVSGDTVRRLIGAWRRDRAPIVRPEREGRHGHPVLFDAALLPELLGADPLAGAHAVVHAHADVALNLAVDDPGAFEDIDTPGDYLRVFGREVETEDRS